ncbi:MAG: hypothetical protein ACK558_03130 [Pseudomonadota bacterium]|jgi:hypothetical protein
MSFSDDGDGRPAPMAGPRRMNTGVAGSAVSERPSQTGAADTGHLDARVEPINGQNRNAMALRSIT